MLAVIERQAERVRAPLRVAGEHWNANEERGRLVYQDDDGLLDLPAPQAVRPPPVRQCRRRDRGAARGAACSCRSPAFEAGIAKAEWPARMQRLSQGTLVALAPPDSELWLDGGHNADGGRAVAAALADLEERVPRPLVLIVGMLATKDSAGFLRNFAGLARRVDRGADPAPGEERAAPKRSRRSRARVGIPAREPRQIEDALAAIGRLGLAPRAAHPDHRLALSRRRGAGANGTPPE